MDDNPLFSWNDTPTRGAILTFFVGRVGCTTQGLFDCCTHGRLPKGALGSGEEFFV